MAQAEAPLSAQDPTAAAVAEAEVPPEIVAQSLGEWFQAWILRIRSGDSGVLPVLLGMVIITIVFEAISPQQVFLSAPNLVNLFQQSAVFMVLAMGETFALLLGEIDLSIGWVGATGAAIAVQLVQPATTKWPWWGALVAALLICALIGAIQGTMIARLRLSSLIVTLAGGLIFQGVTLIILLFGPFSGNPSLAGTDTNKQVLYNLMWGTIDPVISWIGAAVIVIGIAAFLWTSDDRRRRSGLVAPPVSLTLLKIGVIAIAAVVVVGICNANRAALGTLEGVPWVIPIVLAVFGAWMLLLQKTRFGRYVYAIGGNREAARRAGIKVPVIITWCFTISAFTAGIGALLFASNGGGISGNFPGAALVLYAIAAAVIGGTGLFGGRGKVLHGILGGLVIGGIYNGMYLLTIPVQWQYIVIGLVLLAAVTVDSLSRRGATSGVR
ncbi:MAG TPA: ABC transporter permease [Candidatus Dormibacteraeota bacterium]|nr:ABC transporter permease [Candidatus Dormibacteraeota bacterium]